MACPVEHLVACPVACLVACPVAFPVAFLVAFPAVDPACRAATGVDTPEDTGAWVGRVDNQGASADQAACMVASEDKHRSPACMASYPEDKTWIDRNRAVSADRASSFREDRK